MTASKRRKVNRSTFGSTRKLPSGRWQARYPDEHGDPMTAPATFATKAEATDHLAAVRADRARGSYLDHREGGVLFEVFAAEWIANGGARGHLAPRTADLYADHLRRHLAPLHGLTLAQIRPDTVRRWYRDTAKSLAGSSGSGSRVARRSGSTALRQSYALLRAIMSTAVVDRKIAANPCTIRGAGIAEQNERPLLSVSDFMRIVEHAPEHIRPALHVMFGAHLRLGELIGLQRGDLDVATGILSIERQVVTVRAPMSANGETNTGTRTTTEATAPKSGKARAVALPAVTLDVLRAHLDGSRGFARGPMFAQRDGGPFTRTMLHQAWRKAADAAGYPDAHLHDLRHAGLTLAAQSGATLAELKQRAGHSTAAAALRYQHAAQERGAVIAAGMNAALDAASAGPTGTRVARDAVEH